MSETWLPVVGVKGYEVSDMGRVRSVDRMVTQLSRHGTMTSRKLKGRILKPGRTKMVNGQPGYFFVKVPGNITLLIHRAVLEAHVGPCPPGMRDGCHKDDNRDDNRLVNLEWGTHAANQAQAVEHGLNHNANKTHCKRRHKFTPENTRWVKSRNGRPRRNCRQCGVEAQQRYRDSQEAP